MGGGGLRILGHKRWHVWRRDNIERVTRDEENEKESKLEKERKEKFLEQEQRYELQQGKLQKQTEVKPFNLFYIEEQLGTQRKIESERNVNTLSSQKYSPWYILPKGVESQSKRRKRESEDDPLLCMRPQSYQKQYRDTAHALQSEAATSLAQDDISCKKKKKKKKSKSKSVTLEKLRQEREEREANERRRTRRIIGE
ncbi:unnamed protein product [Albugo candida]|uniref:CBF1-interacting co-repressor CIR N-terminal domain-containing protein n=1 Tax=Albugo candida TaxID=65357 RepID=A0A024GMW2_9STRA|nr:unnamed protein product [Albugo candida]|eukprot:CCI47684.1 unnamed protein product [Albugo candida]